jgi:hypothetical protein
MAAMPVARAAAGRAAAGRAAAGRAGAKSAAGGRAAARRPSAGRRITSDLSPDQVTAELQRRRQEAAAGAPEPAADPEPAAAAPSPSGGRPAAGVKASSAGGGFALGVFIHVLGITYLRSGRAGVKAWLKAKFLNEVP